MNINHALKMLAIQNLFAMILILVIVIEDQPAAVNVPVLYSKC